MKKELRLTNRSIDKIGLSKDYKDAIIQYVWNGFEAGATKVYIKFDNKDAIGHINTFSIYDNGTGINFNDLGATFGILLDSPKQSHKRSSYVKGGKGKGRLSFRAFAHKATWKTIFKQEGKLFGYSISVESDDSTNYEFDDELREVFNESTGTEVIFTGLYEINAHWLESEDLVHALSHEFGWFLLLNRQNKFSIYINDIEIDYQEYISDEDSFSLMIDNSNQESYKFEVTYIRWDDKIGEDSFFHFINTDNREVDRLFTSANKGGGRAYGFFHSLYVTSSYFDKYSQAKKEKDQIDLYGVNQYDAVCKKLLDELKKYLRGKRDDFYRLKADNTFNEYQVKELLPNFGNDKYAIDRKEDFRAVFHEIFLIEPNLFIGSKDNHIKSLLGMMNLLLQSDERENLLTIIESVVNDLDKEGREKLASILEHASLANIVRTIDMIKSRQEVIDLLNTLVFELKKFTSERDHIQTAIEENTWIFGEEFALVSKDENFEIALSQYLGILDGVDPKNVLKKKMTHEEKMRRMDIFLSRQRLVDSMDYGDTPQIEENLIIELKNPRITLGKTQLRQVEDYRDIIMSEEQFQTETRVWKFFAVGNSIDDYIRSEYDSMKDKGKKFLVSQHGNFEIFFMTWTDIFNTYKIRHKYLMDKLDLRRDSLLSSFEKDEKKYSKRTSANVTSSIVNKAQSIK